MANLWIRAKFRLRLKIRLSPKFRLAERKQNGGKTKPKMVKLHVENVVSVSRLWQQLTTLSTLFIMIVNYHGKQRKHICLDCNVSLFTKHNKIIQKSQWFLVIKKDDLLVIRVKGMHFCITELGIRRYCSDWLWSWPDL